MTSRRKGAQSRYFSGSSTRKNTSEYCSDKRLLPRIKQLLESSDDAMDIGEIAQALQDSYPEYARRKQLAFRQLVGKVYSSGMKDGAWLEEREREHVRKWQSKQTDGVVSVDSGQSDSEAEMDVYDDHNMMNNSIVQLYGSSPATQPLAETPNEAKNKVPVPEGSQDCDNEDQVLQNPAHCAQQPLHSGADKQDEGKVVEEPKSKRAKRSQDEIVETGKDKPKKKRLKDRSYKTKEVSSAVQEDLLARHKKEFKVQTSAVRFSNLGGCERVLEDVCRLLLHLRHPELFARLGVRPPQGFLLHGPPGCGKTLLAHAIAGELSLPFLKLAATEVVSGVSGESESSLRDLFQVAKENAPCVLFIDEVDAICPKRETAQREMERRIVTQLLTCLDDLNQSDAGAQVLVIGATSRADSLDPALRRSGRFDREICLGIPGLKQRESILRLHCSNLRLEDGFNFKVVSEASPGYVGADLVALVREASLCAINRLLSLRQAMVGGEETSSSELISLIQHQTAIPESILESIHITQADFSEALKSVQPSAKREGFATVPDTTWADVGALEEVREELAMAILAPVRYPDHFSQLGLTAAPGVLLAGPPGCGKTLLAKAIANESGINFISVKGPELLNMYVGESERAVRQVFQRARNSSPCVIFFDELDSLCPKRSENAQTNASARVVNQLLTEMDGIESRRQVYVMGATNRPDIIDPAVLRPGRLDKVLYIGLPSDNDRRDILMTITKGGTKPRLADDVDLTQISFKCNGFSGADLSALVREASIISLKEYMKMKPKEPLGVMTARPNMEVSMKHFENALGKIRPSVSPQDSVFYQEMAKRFTQIRA